MHVYCAAVFGNSYCRGQNRYVKLNEHEQSLVNAIPNILESYHYVHKQKWVDDMRRENAHVFMDSGAFSAWTLKVELSIVEYCEYLRRNADIIRIEEGSFMASVLDKIGDKKVGLGTYINQKHMEYLGVRPLPCFHKGDDERWLVQYLEDGYEYITLGGMVGTSTDQLRKWLDRIWERYLVDGTGKPKVKVHGFGMTSVELMEIYPWYSVDSSSWIQSAAFGNIVMPRYRDDTIPHIKSEPIKVSDKSPSRHDAGQHITTLSQIEQDHLFKTLEAQGFTFERLSTIYESRAAYNLWAFGLINKYINAAHDNTFKARVQELF